MTDPLDDGDDGDPSVGGVTADDASVTDVDPIDDSESAATEPADTTTDSADRSVVATDVETPGEPRTLDSRVRISWLVGPAFGAVAAALVAMVVTYTLEFEWLPFGREVGALAVGGLVFALLGAYGVVRTIYLYRSWRYVVRDESLYLTRGVFTKVQTVVPYVRVQHIDTRRSAFERVLGLSRLVVYTAGSRGADVTIPGLEPDHAEELQSRLERLAIASEDEDAV